eukprot:Rhum_TRINITY_DN8416_c1_g1::Rhum_TRINITY_DN8416_c1_g1_i1::g.27903::m.27903
MGVHDIVQHLSPCSLPLNLPVPFERVANLVYKGDGRRFVLGNGDLVLLRHVVTVALLRIRPHRVVPAGDDKVCGGVGGLAGGGKRGHELVRVDWVDPVRAAQAVHRSLLGHVLPDGVLHDLEERLVGFRVDDPALVDELRDETAETLEGTGDTRVRVHLDGLVLDRVDVDLHVTLLAQRHVEDGEKHLVHDVRAEQPRLLLLRVEEVHVFVVAQHLAFPAPQVRDGDARALEHEHHTGLPVLRPRRLVHNGARHSLDLRSCNSGSRGGGGREGRGGNRRLCLLCAAASVSGLSLFAAVVILRHLFFFFFFFRSLVLFLSFSLRVCTKGSQ